MTIFWIIIGISMFVYQVTQEWTDHDPEDCEE